MDCRSLVGLLRTHWFSTWAQHTSAHRVGAVFGRGYLYCPNEDRYRAASTQIAIFLTVRHLMTNSQVPLVRKPDPQSLFDS